MWDSENHRLTVELANGTIFHVHVLAPHTFRIQLREGNTSSESALVRYGILNVQQRCEEEPLIRTTAETVIIETSEARLRVDRADGRLSLTRPDGTPLLENNAAPWSNPAEGFGSAFTLAEGERIVGLGDVTRDRLQKRGYRTMMWVCNVESYVPDPLYYEHPWLGFAGQYHLASFLRHR